MSRPTKRSRTTSPESGDDVSEVAARGPEKTGPLGPCLRHISARFGATEALTCGGDGHRSGPKGAVPTRCTHVGKNAKTDDRFTDHLLSSHSNIAAARMVLEASISCNPPKRRPFVRAFSISQLTSLRFRRRSRRTLAPRAVLRTMCRCRSGLAPQHGPEPSARRGAYQTPRRVRSGPRRPGDRRRRRSARGRNGCAACGPT